MNCNKCKGPAAIILRKSDYYCKECFVININHKFRACIGKNKIHSSNERILTCISSGAGSAALVHFIYDGISIENHKKLRIFPSFLHIIGTTNNSRKEAEKILVKCQQYKFDVYFVHISKYESTDDELCANNIPTIDDDVMHNFSLLMDSLTATTRNDLIQKIKRNIYLNVAKKLGCSSIFTAETTTTLATNLLSNLAVGRGSQVEHDVGFCDTRNSIKIVRPMKDISQEELDQYIKIKELDALVKNPSSSHSSLQSVIFSFVSNLQENSPATIFTICKTADKIGAQNKFENQAKCSLCESVIKAENVGFTAFEATTVSRALSNKEKSQVHDKTLANISVLANDPSIFNPGTKTLCYTCTKSYVELSSNSSNIIWLPVLK